MPTEIVELEHPDFVSTDLTSETIALFDDASYSGSQLAGYITSLCGWSSDERGVAKKNTTTLVKTIYVVVPFMSAYAINKLEALSGGR